MPVRRGLWLILALVAVPSATAAPAEALYLASGYTFFAPTADAEARRLEALLVEDTTDLSVSITAPEGHLCRVHQILTEVEVLDWRFKSARPGPPDIRCFPLTGLEIASVPGNHSGWLGVYPSHAAEVRLSIEKVNATTFSRFVSPEFSTAGVTTAESLDGPDQPHYVRETATAHMDGVAKGNVVYRGPVRMKVLGPDVLVTANENTTRYETRDEAASQAAVRQRDREWLYLDLDDAEMTLRSDRGIRFAADELQDVASEGTVRFTPMSGEMEAAGAIYYATGAQEALVGSFRGSVKPESDEPELARLSLVGNMESTSLKAVTSAPAPATDGFASGLLIGLALAGAGALVGAGMAFKSLWEKRGLLVTASIVEDGEWWAAYHEHYAKEAIDVGDEETAICHLYAAQRVAPHDHQIPLWLGIIYEGQGLPEHAAEEYEEAAKVADVFAPDDGAPYLHLAAIHADHIDDARPEDKDARAQLAVTYLERALGKQPKLVSEVREDVFRPIMGDAFDSLIEEASRRAEGGATPE